MFVRSLRYGTQYCMGDAMLIQTFSAVRSSQKMAAVMEKLDDSNKLAPTSGANSQLVRLCPGSVSNRGDVHHVFVQCTTGAETHVTIDQSKQSVVFANADIHAGMEFGSTLTNNDCTSGDVLTTELLHPKHLWLGVTSISRRAAAFFLCHF